ncbi:NAD-dependent deacetylase hst3 [Sporothrix bragantina]|uniref:NAD-dependent deacetylase hst3 n=1 Tax=Sporothrix bragantina TaxID=671064 RepID=A0ABP0BAW8_9PEZI
MPTSHVLPESAELLQEIADALWKAKKVVVVTGAGISTNSGIPDFRSKNGLYSLIQAQFEEAAARKDDSEQDDEEDVNDEENDTAPASKRQKVTEKEEAVRRVKTEQRTTTKDGQDATPESRRRGRRSGRTRKDLAPEREEQDTIHCAAEDPADDGDSIVVQLPALDPKKFAQPLMTPKRRSSSRLAAVMGESIECMGSLPLSSSPLSSPPSILFDPSEEYRSGSATSARSSSSNSSLAPSPCSSDVESDCEDITMLTSSSQPTLSTQTSFASNKSTLPFMKGRDLFDASIWADPVKTSVFYTFATTLRQKVKEVVPTRSHEFISHLRDTNKLVRCYTQNIDEIEEKVGLSTSLFLGPGKKGRFSTRSSASRASLGLGAGVAGKDESSQGSQDSQADSQELASSQDSQDSQSSEDLSASQSSQSLSQSQTDPKNPAKNRDPCFRGVECVFLHGSLSLLRCFRCGQTTPWDEAGREDETMCGRQPSCPRCAGATAAREGRGKRALAVGKLRPDIVLYGEEHPNAHLISPIVQHDLSLTPDMLLILGTSLKVHGLKVLVREFAKAVHSRGGKVVFVNYTKPPESVWSDIIDYWVQWDCDTWVEDLKQKKPIMWLPPGSVIDEPKKKRKSISAGGAAKGNKRNSDCAKAGETGELSTNTTPPDGSASPMEGEANSQKPKKKRGRPPKNTSEKADTPADNDKPEEKADEKTPAEPGPFSETTSPTQPKEDTVQEPTKEAATEKKKRGRKHNPNAKYPAATRDDQTNGAIVVWKIDQELARFSGRTPPEELPAPVAPGAKTTKRRPKQRQSAPGELEIVLSTIPRVASPVAAPSTAQTSPPSLPSLRHPEEPMPLADISANILLNTTTTFGSARDKYSIRSAVKANPRVRQPKKIFESGGGRTGGPLMVPVQPVAPLKRQSSSTPTPTQSPPPEQHSQRQPIPLQKQPRKQAKARARSKSMAAPLSTVAAEAPATPAPQAPITMPAPAVAGWLDIDRMAEQLKMDMSTSWSAQTNSEPATPAPTSTVATKTNAPSQTPLPQQAAATSTPPSTTLPSIREMFSDFLPMPAPMPAPMPRPMSMDNAFFHQDPLGKSYSYPPPWPQQELQEWSVSNQVEREAVEQQLKASVDGH